MSEDEFSAELKKEGLNEVSYSLLLKEATPEEKEFARFCRKEEDEFALVSSHAERIYYQNPHYDPDTAWLAAQRYHTFYTNKRQEVKDRINRKKAELNIPETSYYYNDYND